jgi:polyhydroxybutyrate depolymerase
VKGIRFSGCANQVEVILFSIEGSGHTWPGGEPMSGLLVGNTNSDIDASTELWTFFNNHPLNDAP